MSDKYLMEHCVFFMNLLPGDLILADRGFDIKERALLCIVLKLKLPHSRGEKTFSREPFQSITLC